MCTLLPLHLLSPLNHAGQESKYVELDKEVKIELRQLVFQIGIKDNV